MRLSCVVLAALLASAPASGQEGLVARERFPFAGSRLTIRVEAGPRGTLRVIRGGPGSVRVASRAELGFAAVGLGENEELTLTAAGAGPVDYMVSVPDNVWIDVRLPGHSFAESIASSARSRTFEWPSEADRRERAPRAWAPPAGEASVYTTYTRERAPRVVRLPGIGIRSLGVRVEEGPFRVRTSRPLTVERGADDRLEIRADLPTPLEVLISVPAGTPEFRLDAGGATAMLVRGDSVAVFCSLASDQRLSHGRRWLTFTTTDGKLACRP